jgi:hypothetical protein
MLLATSESFPNENVHYMNIYCVSASIIAENYNIIINCYCPSCRSKGLPRSFPSTSIRCQPLHIFSVPSARFSPHVAYIAIKLRKCALLAHSSPVLCWNSRLSPKHLHVSHFVWRLPFDLLGLGDPTNSYATADIALRVIGEGKPHHHKAETHGGLIT